MAKNKLKKSKARQILAGLSQRPATVSVNGQEPFKASINHKPLWVTLEDVDLLKQLVVGADKYDPRRKALDSMLERLGGVEQELLDRVQQLHEIVARERANGFWSDTENVLRDQVKKLRKDQQKRHRQAEEEINCLPAEEMRALLEVASHSGLLNEDSLPEPTSTVESSDNPEGNVVELPSQPLGPHGQQDGSPAAPVTGNEGEKLEISEGNRGLRGGLETTS